MNTYATDGRCHNAEPGTFGHECGKPATWIGTKRTSAETARSLRNMGCEATEGDVFECGFCNDCKAHGTEARAYRQWRRAMSPAQRELA